MGFWEAATDQAGRRFGDRFWGWFVAARVVRALAPFFAVVVLGGGLVLAYRWLSPDWAAIGGATAGAAAAVGAGTLWIILSAVLLAAVVGVGLWVKAHWWKLMLHRPMWMRRY